MDSPCTITYNETEVVILQKGGSTATLRPSQVTGVNLLKEKDFMQRFKGNASSSKVLGQSKYFLAIEYISSMGELKRLDFWTWEAGLRILAVNRFRKFIETNAIPQQQKLLTVYTYTGRCRQ